MKVSVIVPSYNCARFLLDSLQSAMAQSFQDFEIILLDDGSTDNTREIVKPFLEQYPQKIKYIYQENRGLAAARNTAIRVSQGELIALLDADDIWCNNRLEEGVRLLDQHPEVGLVHARTVRIDEHKNPLGSIERFPEYLSGNIFRALYLRQADISCPTVLFRKECCEKSGFFDESLTRLGCEDRDLWLRLSKYYQCQFIDKVLANYRILSQSMSKNVEKMMKARIYVAEKYYKSGDADFFLYQQALSRIYKDLGDGFFYARQYCEALKAYGKALKHWPLSLVVWKNLLKSLLKMRPS